MNKLTAIDWAKELNVDDESVFPEDLAFAHPEPEITHDQHKELEAFLQEFQVSEEGPVHIKIQPH
jgi:hypothetical protein